MQSDPDNIRGLIERIEAASEGSRELDAEIGRTCGWVQKSHSQWGIGAPHWWRDGRCQSEIIGWWHSQQAASLPAFTFSLDAAITLVPQGMHWCVDSDGDRYMASASVGPQPIGGELYEPHAIADAETPALALCAASLKAMETPNG